jgi:segregation and condensation protein B
MSEHETNEVEPITPEQEQSGRPEEPEAADVNESAAEWPEPDEPAEDGVVSEEEIPETLDAAEEAPEAADETDEAADEAEDEDAGEAPLPDDGDEDGGAAAELPPETAAFCRTAIEAMLFASAEPVRSRKLADALKDTGIDGRAVRKIVAQLAREYEETQRGFIIEAIAGGFQMLTRPDHAEYVAALFGGGGGGKLSQAALETLAVVAYKQPVTRADIEAIRGVQAGPLLRALLHKGLIKITGRAEVLGRPLLYGTTKRFLEHFGLKSLNELPKVEELPKP